jgi:hypothetical protein
MDRNLQHDTNYGFGLVRVNFSFTVNGTSAVATSSIRGVDPGVIASITYSATGKHIIVLSDKFRYVVAKSAALEDIASPDGAYATIGPVTNEGSSSIGPTFTVAQFDAAGVLTAHSARRMSVSLVLKNSTVGV